MLALEERHVTSPWTPSLQESGAIVMATCVCVCREFTSYFLFHSCLSHANLCYDSRGTAGRKMRCVYF